MEDRIRSRGKLKKGEEIRLKKVEVETTMAAVWAWSVRGGALVEQFFGAGRDPFVRRPRRGAAAARRRSPRVVGQERRGPPSPRRRLFCREPSDRTSGPYFPDLSQVVGERVTVPAPTDRNGGEKSPFQ